MSGAWRGGRRSTIFERWITTVAEKSQQYHKYFLQYSTFASEKTLGSNMGRASFASCPGHRNRTPSYLVTTLNDVGVFRKNAYYIRFQSNMTMKGLSVRSVWRTRRIKKGPLENKIRLFGKKSLSILNIVMFNSRFSNVCAKITFSKLDLLQLLTISVKAISWNTLVWNTKRATCSSSTVS